MIFTILAVLIGFFLGLFIHKLKKSDGTLKYNTDKNTGRMVYRFEFDIPLEDIPIRKKLIINVKETNENLDINQRLYDLEEEGIEHDC